MKYIQLSLTLFVLLISLSANSQSLYGLSPDSGWRSQNLDVYISGESTFFTGSSVVVQVQFFHSSTTTVFSTSNIAYPSDSVTIANVDIPNNAGLGNYHVSLSYSSGSYMWLPNAFKVTFPASTPEGQQTIHLNIYPNPADNVLNLHFDNISEPMQIRIINMNGQILKSKTITSANNYSTIDVEDLPAGVYHLEYNSSKQSGIETWIKK